MYLCKQNHFSKQIYYTKQDGQKYTYLDMEYDLEMCEVLIMIYIQFKIRNNM